MKVKSLLASQYYLRQDSDIEITVLEALLQNTTQSFRESDVLYTSDHNDTQRKSQQIR